MSDFELKRQMASLAGNTDALRRLQNEVRDKDAKGHGSDKHGGSASDKTREMLDKAGYKRISGKGFGVDAANGDTAHSKGKGEDQHVAVVREDGVSSHLPYGPQPGRKNVKQFDEAEYSHSEFQKKLDKGIF